MCSCAMLIARSPHIRKTSKGFVVVSMMGMICAIILVED